MTLPKWLRTNELEGLVAATPARTPAGVMAQMRIFALWQGELSGVSNHGRRIEGAIATLERLAGEARHV